jgi:hypothetical protein
VLQCPWLLQLLITDDTDTVVAIMDLIPKILRVNRYSIHQIVQLLTDFVYLYSYEF